MLANWRSPYGTVHRSELLVNYAWSLAAIMLIRSGMMVKTDVSNGR